MTRYTINVGVSRSILIKLQGDNKDLFIAAKSVSSEQSELATYSHSQLESGIEITLTDHPLMLIVTAVSGSHKRAAVNLQIADDRGSVLRKTFTVDSRDGAQIHLQLLPWYRFAGPHHLMTQQGTGATFSRRAPSYGSSKQPDLEYAEVEVLYGTDRLFTGGRYSEEYGSLSFGKCRITIPSNHKYGTLESPWFSFLGVKPRPKRHVTLKGLNRLDSAAFVKEMQARMAKPQASGQALLFVHGFNVTFVDAARRTGQLAYDLDFPGAPLFYAWPSTGNVDPGYRRDSDRHVESVPKFIEFLTLVLQQESVEQLYIIAHSLGTRVVLTAVQELRGKAPVLTEKVEEIVLAAPDINAKVFEEQIAPRLQPPNDRMTLYVSSNDKALQLSKQFNNSRRLGSIDGTSVSVLPGMDTIDVSNVSTDWLGHSRFGNTPALVTDMKWLITERTRAPRANQVRRQNSSGLTYYYFRR